MPSRDTLLSKLRRHAGRSAVFGTLLSIAFSAAAEEVDFATAENGPAPAAFDTRMRTGGGRPGRWEVVSDNTAKGSKALAQLEADPTDYRFPLAIYLPAMIADLEATPRFKPVSGKVDQAGGLAVRLSDSNNYYLTRANALEDNVSFYRVVKGRRQELASANVKVSAGEWHTLTLRAEGNRFTVSFDGKQLLSHADSTFTAPGKVALWTKADSVTRFEFLVINPLR